MGEAFITRRGGSGGSGCSELMIFGGTTRPAKADHNAIWLNTPNEIKSYALTPTEPETPVEGMAWIIIGTSGAVKMVSPVGGDWITVYPISAKQYVNGAWVNVEAKSYQNGEWVGWWDGTIYHYGNLYEQFTGGWKKLDEDSVTPTITYAEDYIEMKASGSSGKMSALRVVNTFDLTNVTSITAEIQSNKYNRVGIFAKHATTGVSSYVRATTNDKTTVTLDTSALSDEHIIMGRIDWSESETFWLRIYSIKLNFG